MNRLSGVIVAAATPVGEDFLPDHGLFHSHVKNLIDEGCHYVAPFGTTGEANSFPVEARIDALRAIVEGGIEPGRLVPGTGASSLQDALKITRNALDLGVAGVMILPPFYYPDQGGVPGLASYYRPLVELAAKADTPVLFYNIPQLSKIRITLELMDAMRADFGTIAHGVKDSSGDPEQFAAYMARADDYAIFPGSEMLLAKAVAGGGAGCISGPANLSAELFRKSYDVLLDGKSETHETVRALTSIRKVVQQNPLIPAIKFLLSRRYETGSWHRFAPPLIALPDAARNKLLSGLEETGFWSG